MNIKSILAILDRIYCNLHVPTNEDSISFATLFCLGMRIKLVDFAFDTFSLNVRNLEQSVINRLIRLFNTNDQMSIENELMPLLYYTDNYLLQLRIVMDYWSVYFSLIQEYNNIGLSFNKHKKNINSINDRIYSDYIANMEWFNDMKITRDEIKSGKMKYFYFDKNMKCYILMHTKCLGFQQIKAKTDSGIVELLSSYHDCFWDYNNFVFKHFDRAFP